MSTTASSHLKASSILPILPVRNVVLFPGVSSLLLVGRTAFRRLVEEASGGDCRIAVFTQVDAEEENPSPSALHPVGVVAIIHRVYKLPDDHMQVLVRTTGRIRLGKVAIDQPYILAEYDLVAEKTTGDQREIALVQNIYPAIPEIGDPIYELRSRAQCSYCQPRETTRTADMGYNP